VRAVRAGGEGPIGRGEVEGKSGLIIRRARADDGVERQSTRRAISSKVEALRSEIRVSLRG